MSTTPWPQLIEWVSAMAPGLEVIRPNQNAPAPVPPYLTVETLGHREVGTMHPGGVKAKGDGFEVKGFINQVFTLRINAYSTTTDPLAARDIIESIQLGTKNREFHADILKQNVAFQFVLSAMNDVSGLLGDSYQGRAFIDLQMEVAIPFAYSKGRFDRDVSTIERVITYATVEDSTPTPIDAIIDSNPPD